VRPEDLETRRNLINADRYGDAKLGGEEALRDQQGELRALFLKALIPFHGSEGMVQPSAFGPNCPGFVSCRPGCCSGDYRSSWLRDILATNEINEIGYKEVQMNPLKCRYGST